MQPVRKSLLPALLCVLALLMALPAVAQVPRAVLAELASATW